MQPSPDSQRASARPPALDASSGGGSPDSSRWDRRAKLVVLVTLALLLFGAWRVGPTFDEHFYIASGYSYWKTGDFALNREHPPLVKLLVGLPLLFAPDVSWTEGATQLLSFPRTWFFQMNGEHLTRNLFLARLPICLATAALAWLVYRTARRLFSARAAFFALIAFALNPNLLAHGRLAALDGGLTVFLFLAVLSFAELIDRFGWRRLVVAGLCFGLANLAKFTSLVMLPVFLALATIVAVRRRSLEPLGSLTGTVLIGLGVFAAGYGFEAKSVAEVSAGEAYFEQAPAYAVESFPPERLAVLALEHGLDPTRAMTIERAGDNLAAIAVIAGELGDDERAQRVRTFVLRDLADADDATRRFAAEQLLAADTLDGEDRETLAELAGVRLSSEAAWRSWFAANRESNWDRELFANGALNALTRGVLGDERPIPLLTALKGVDYQLRHGSEGHGTVFRGQPLSPGADFEHGNPFPEYYAVVWAVKNPLGFSLLLLFGVAAMWTQRERLGFVRLFALVGFPLALFLMFSAGNALLGVKYLLPIFPFAALWIAAAVQRLPRLGAALAVVAVLESGLLLPEPSLTTPNELMYYNALAGGPVGGPAITVVGDDWGQDARKVGEFYARHRGPIERAGGLYYDPYTRAELASIGLSGIERSFEQPAGIVAVHAIDYYRERERYEWLRAYTPFARLGWSVYLYDTRVAAPGGDPLSEWKREDS